MICINCLKDKTGEEFYWHKGRDKPYRWCKQCHCIRTTAAKPKYASQYAAYRQTEGYKVLKRRRQKRYRQNHREKVKAHMALMNEIRQGRMHKQPCKRCGELKAEAHHEDYTKPLDVVWLCPKHHNERHKELDANLYPKV